jgi:putative molybdopterin biosynthesis protein
MPKIFLTAEEAAHLLGISRAKMYQILRKGELSVYRIDKSMRIKSDDLMAWMETTRQSYYGELEMGS